jgi:phosphoribosyl-ATP pyrophosphohydrolase
LWIKGKTSGATQGLLKIDLDCDRDTLRFTVRQTPPGFCHLDTHTCWGDAHGLPALARLIADRHATAPEGSYTARLFNEAGLLDAKLLEEARELAEAQGAAEVTHEAADLIYFTLAAMARAGVDLAGVERELERRSRRLTRRLGNKKG